LWKIQVLIDLDKLPVGDPTLSAKEIIGNESQERMGLVIGQKDIDTYNVLLTGARPMYQVGDVTETIVLLSSQNYC
jgi:phosphoribosylformylglycinamidine synthase